MLSLISIMKGIEIKRVIHLSDFTTKKASTLADEFLE